ncbi:HPr family phosphocarrier protein [Microbacterium sp. LRZ72]|uniref:HPr family phosphocarrier protein n=1 Tax=Microbacterium sp. LRZ72 TaxID=2942481 RepID=UPI0029A640E2|nr:HPr family phosphocarrier protein [Microbacterium sp. LRZ72]MDX2376989.1 HPr family phosphocarrier protein [Microbacterium sp. LRZ72]
MPERRITVTTPEGLHARPAAELVRLARAHGAPVRVGVDGGEPVDAAGILGLMTLGVERGDTVIVTVDGAGAEVLLARIEALLASA